MSTKFLFTNGVLSSSSFDTPSITTFLETHPGAYTTTRTHNNGEFLLFWDRHLKRLSNSLQILLNSNPNFIFGPKFCGVPSFSSSVDWDGLIRRRVNGAMRNALPIVIKERNLSEELSISTLIGGNCEGLKEVEGRVEEEMIDRVLDVYVHIGMYVPPVFGGESNAAQLAVVGCRRDFAEAKYSDWARLRKPLELMRPPSTTELLLSDNGDQILEGTITNFFVVRFKEDKEVKGKHFDSYANLNSYELQTAPVRDGVLPGIIRQLVIEICLKKGITVREVSPSWSERDSWEEAFVTNSLRLLQHVETIQAPQPRTSMGSKSWEEVKWVKKYFKGNPGTITTLIQIIIYATVLLHHFLGWKVVCKAFYFGMDKGEIMRITGLEGYPLALLNRL